MSSESCSKDGCFEDSCSLCREHLEKLVDKRAREIAREEIRFILGLKDPSSVDPYNPSDLAKMERELKEAKRR